ncbi:MAG: hypothetical protein AAF639_31890 [Chloroflexota bacterium]
MKGPNVGKFAARIMTKLAVLSLLGVAILTETTLAMDLVQETTVDTIVQSDSLAIPTFWYLLAAGLSFLVPAGFVFISVAGLPLDRAWDAMLGAGAAIGLAVVVYWAVGFALQFGGIGLVYEHPQLDGLIWEWSALSDEWGVGWGMAGLSGWFLSGPDITALTYALFLTHLPWVVTITVLPIIALRGRAPSTVTLLLALFIGGFLYPLAGNWVQGGGWLNALGRNLNMGHGLVDFGGAATVFLLAAGFSIGALVIWVPRKKKQSLAEIELPPAQLPAMAVVGSLLILGGGIGWYWANPLHASSLTEMALMRGSVNSILYAGGGLLVPLLYTWFVTGQSDALMTARGLMAGAVAGFAIGPFVEPGTAFLIGFIAGATVPFVAFIVDNVLRLDDATGVLSVCGVPAMIGLLAVGIWADGQAGNGWQMTGVGRYLGIDGQGVSGLFTAAGYVPDFPGQIQAQIVGIISIGLWGLVLGLVLCAPLGLLFYGIERATSGRASQDVLYNEMTRPNPVNEPLKQLTDQLNYPSLDQSSVPVQSPVQSPAQYPNNIPTPYPTDMPSAVPFASQPVSPTASPTVSPTASPTINDQEPSIGIPPEPRTESRRGLRGRLNRPTNPDFDLPNQPQTPRPQEELGQPVPPPQPYPNYQFEDDHSV